eukprot:GHVU01088345.1.p1 GENE.GHVU01088345.1~~GHVU01088345.1.p1  ORF type:complete len:393 (+),score=63.60 GHVU01088345.1:556-1734(+)
MDEDDTEEDEQELEKLLTQLANGNGAGGTAADVMQGWRRGLSTADAATTLMDETAAGAADTSTTGDADDDGDMKFLQDILFRLPANRSGAAAEGDSLLEGQLKEWILGGEDSVRGGGGATSIDGLTEQSLLRGRDTAFPSPSASQSEAGSAAGASFSQQQQQRPEKTADGVEGPLDSARKAVRKVTRLLASANKRLRKARRAEELSSCSSTPDETAQAAQVFALRRQILVLRRERRICIAELNRRRHAPPPPQPRVETLSPTAIQVDDRAARAHPAGPMYRRHVATTPREKAQNGNEDVSSLGVIGRGNANRPGSDTFAHPPRGGRKRTFRSVGLIDALVKAGVATKEGCEAAVEAGVVRVNNQKVSTKGHKVDPETDAVEVLGKPVTLASQ